MYYTKKRYPRMKFAFGMIIEDNSMERKEFHGKNRHHNRL